jgi:hypothetical protein
VDGRFRGSFLFSTGAALSEIDPSTNLSDALSDLIAFDAQGRAVWPAKELERMLGRQVGEFLKSEQSGSVRELLESSDPSIEVLIELKNLAKRRPKHLFPPEMALLLYYGTIAAAMVKCAERITKLRDEDLRDGFTWAIKQPWVPEEICELFRQATSKLGGGQWRE